MGITLKDNNNFVFDFNYDGTNDIIHLIHNGYQVTAFNKCFYYGYEFGEDVEGRVRSAFIKYSSFAS